MRYKINEHEYDGTPQEIADLLKLVGDNKQVTTEHVEDAPAFKPDDFAPLESVVSESQKLREELAKNPSYNPFPGVSRSLSSDNTEQASPAVSAEDNTGVDII